MRRISSRSIHDSQDVSVPLPEELSDNRQKIFSNDATTVEEQPAKGRRSVDSSAW